MGLKNKDGSGNCVSMNTSTETIPHKAKDRKRGDRTAAASPGGATHGGDAKGAKGGGRALCKNTTLGAQTLGKHTPRTTVRSSIGMAPPNRTNLAVAMTVLIMVRRAHLLT